MDRNPVDPGRFYRHGLDAALHQPVGQAVEVGGEGAKFTHRLWVAIARHRNVMLGRPAIDARRVGLNAFQQRGRQTSAPFLAGLARGSFNAIVLHLDLLHSGIGASLRGQGCDGMVRHSPKRDHDQACHQWRYRGTPWTMLRKRAVRTIAKAISVPASFARSILYTNARSVSSLSCRAYPRVPCSGGISRAKPLG